MGSFGGVFVGLWPKSGLEDTNNTPNSRNEDVISQSLRSRNETKKEVCSQHTIDENFIIKKPQLVLM